MGASGEPLFHGEARDQQGRGEQQRLPLSPGPQGPPDQPTGDDRGQRRHERALNDQRDCTAAVQGHGDQAEQRALPGRLQEVQTRRSARTVMQRCYCAAPLTRQRTPDGECTSCRSRLSSVRALAVNLFVQRPRPSLHRSLAQLRACQSPKVDVAGSVPAGPAGSCGELRGRAVDY